MMFFVWIGDLISIVEVDGEVNNATDFLRAQLMLYAINGAIDKKLHPYFFTRLANLLDGEVW